MLTERAAICRAHLARRERNQLKVAVLGRATVALAAYDIIDELFRDPSDDRPFGFAAVGDDVHIRRVGTAPGNPHWAHRSAAVAVLYPGGRPK
jgi:hypothetical protein